MTVIDVDKGMSRIIKQMLAAEGKVVDVGVFGGRAGTGATLVARTASGGTIGVFRGRSGTGRGGARKASIAEVAGFNEFGTKRTTIIGPIVTFTQRGIPSRPFMRRAFDKNQAKYEKALQAGAKRIVEGKDTPEGVLTKVGLKAKNDQIRSITSARSWATPNAPSTIAKKGSSSPLIDTGTMRNALTFQVRKVGSEKGR